jgi:hypothetical protein
MATTSPETVLIELSKPNLALCQNAATQLGLTLDQWCLTALLTLLKLQAGLERHDLPSRRTH